MTLVADLFKTNLRNILLMWLRNFTLVEILLNFVSTFAFMHYQYTFYQRDMLYWGHDIMERPLDYLLSALVQVITIHMVISCLDSTLFNGLVRRHMRHLNQPRIYYEECYRRFIIMRLVQQLDIALTIQKSKDQKNHFHIMVAQELIKRAVNEFRTAVRALLWPTRLDLVTDPHVLFHIDEMQLAIMMSRGYTLSQVSRRDLGNVNIRRMLIPEGNS